MTKVKHPVDRLQRRLIKTRKNTFESKKKAEIRSDKVRRKLTKELTKEQETSDELRTALEGEQLKNS